MFKSMDNLIRLCKENPPCVFSDLDYTCCLSGNSDYERENKRLFGIKKCFLNPNAAKAFLNIRQKGGNVFFVTGRHWSSKRKDPETNLFIEDGALNDLLGGKESPFAKFNAVAGHGRQIVENGKIRLMRRSSDHEQNKAELDFEKFANKKMREAARQIKKLFPDVAKYVRYECKKNLCYVNIISFPAEQNRKRFEEIFTWLRDQALFTVNGQDCFGNKDPSAPPNPNGMFVASFDQSGSAEIRSRSFNKGKTLLKSGFLNNALASGRPVLVCGDSLAGKGTDRDMFSAAKTLFQQNNALNKLFLIQVLNNELELVFDPCAPDIALSSADEFGKLMLSLSE